MSKYIFLAFFLVNISAFVYAQNNPTPFAETITPLDLQRHVENLASEEMEGRETGTEGNRKAAKYIADKLERSFIPPLANAQSYFQTMTFNSETWADIELYVQARRFKHTYHFYALPELNASIKDFETDKVLFVGYGIEEKKYNDYKHTNVKGKTIMILLGEPINDKGISAITQTKEKSDWSTNVQKKLALAYKKGAKMVLLIDSNLDGLDNARKRFTWAYYGQRIDLSNKYPNNLFISQETVNYIAGKDSTKLHAIITKINEKAKPKCLKINNKLKIIVEKRTYQLVGDNVLGYIEGTDTLLKNELIIVSAHYDHLGKRDKDIYYGANDNASGTATVLEIAQAFAEAKRQGKGARRSVLCILMTGEEKGLLGSKYYTEYPVFPLDKTVANINIDMVGRTDDRHKENPNYIYVIGDDKLSTELSTTIKKVNETYTKLDLDYTYNDENDPNRYYYRSDHYNFVQKGIPAVFYFNGTNADYHRITDTADKINYNSIVPVAQLAFYTAWTLANQTERIKIDKTE